MSETTDQMPGWAAELPVPGAEFASKYLIDEEVGAGGFARIYKARRTEVGRTVALKVLLPQMPPPNLYSDEIIARFNREARAVADLKSPYSVTMYDFGRTDSGLLYLSFEFIDGATLADIIDDSDGIDPKRAVHILRQVLLALHEIHEAGFLHRDLKPSNIMLTDLVGEADHVKLLDFGISKAWTHSAKGEPLLGDLTEKGRVVGTPRYMSPEQVVGRPISPATDIYSLGLVTWEMIAGRSYVEGDDAVAIMRGHLSNEPYRPPIRGLSFELNSLLEEMLQQNPEDRPQDVATVLLRLDEIIGDLPRLKGMSGIQDVARRPASAEPTTLNSAEVLERKQDDTMPAAIQSSTDGTTTRVTLTQEKTKPVSTPPELSNIVLRQEPGHLVFEFERPLSASTGTALLVGGGATVMLAVFVSVWLGLVSALALVALHAFLTATNVLEIAGTNAHVFSRVMGVELKRTSMHADFSLEFEGRGSHRRLVANIGDARATLSNVSVEDGAWISNYIDRWLARQRGLS